MTSALPEGTESWSDDRRLPELRREMVRRGVHSQDVTDYALGYVIAATDDLSLAVDAVCMDPRPSWVEEFLGPRMTTEQVAWRDGDGEQP